MRNIVKNLFVIAVFALAFTVLSSGTAMADFVPGDGGGTPPANTSIDLSGLPKATADQSKVQAVLAIVFTIIGALSLLMITIGGLRYAASDGDPQAASKAKGTVIFALIGLLVSISAVAIVTFVLGRV